MEVCKAHKHEFFVGGESKKIRADNSTTEPKRQRTVGRTSGLLVGRQEEKHLAWSTKTIGGES